MDQINPPRIRRRTWIVLALIPVILATVISLDNLQLHTFTFPGGSDIEVKRALTIKALQLIGASDESIVCSDNIQAYNITGYRMMSWEEIEDQADSDGTIGYTWVGAIQLNGDDANITVGNWYAAPRNATSEILAGEGFVYRFHRVLFSIWSWDNNIHIVS